MFVLFFNSQEKIEKWLDDWPPIQKWSDFGVFFLGGVDLRDRHLSESVFQLKDPEVYVIFQLIGGKPILPDVYFRIIEQGDFISSETVGHIGQFFPQKKGPNEGEGFYPDPAGKREVPCHPSF